MRESQERQNVPKQGSYMSVRKRYQSARRNNRRQRLQKTEANTFITKPASSYDSDYKLLFSCPEVVRDLLTGYAQGKWLNDADFSTLVHINGSYVSESGSLANENRRAMVMGIASINILPSQKFYVDTPQNNMILRSIID